jgi:hypothetical protein
VQRSRPEVDLIPAQVYQLGNPQAVSVGYQNHRSVPVAVAVALGGIHKPLDFRFSQILTGPQVAVTAPFGRNCSF